MGREIRGTEEGVLTAHVTAPSREGMYEIIDMASGLDDMAVVEQTGEVLMLEELQAEGMNYENIREVHYPIERVSVQFPDFHLDCEWSSKDWKLVFDFSQSELETDDKRSRVEEILVLLDTN